MTTTVNDNSTPIIAVKPGVPKYMVVLAALCNGAEVNMFGQTLVMGFNDCGFDTLCFKAVREDTKTGKRDEILMAIDIDMNSFMCECEKFTDDELFIIKANGKLSSLPVR